MTQVVNQFHVQTTGFYYKYSLNYDTLCTQTSNSTKSNYIRHCDKFSQQAVHYNPRISLVFMQIKYNSDHLNAECNIFELVAKECKPHKELFDLLRFLWDDQHENLLNFLHLCRASTEWQFIKWWHLTILHKDLYWSPQGNFNQDSNFMASIQPITSTIISKRFT